MENFFVITDYGAVSGGGDCTAAIQAALDAARPVKGVVVVPPGVYACGRLRLYEGVTLSGSPAWTFRDDGASILRLNDPTADCLLDITGAFGCTVKGLCLDGCALGSPEAPIHGVKLYWPVYNGGAKEDTPRIEDCRIHHFSGDGVHLEHIWCFSLRHSMLAFNGGSGLYIDGWDGFVLDNWFSGNLGAGLYADKTIASVTLTGNRVEWNVLAGFCLRNATSINITGNYFDRSGGPALDLYCDDTQENRNITATGNILYRSGKPRALPFADPLESAQARFRRCADLVFSGNALHAGRDDGDQGAFSPEYGIVLDTLKCCIVKDNTLDHAALREVLLDLGHHREGVIVKDNPGKPFHPETESMWSSVDG